MIPEDNDIVSVLKLNKLVFKKDVDNNISEYIQDKLTVENVATFYHLAELYKLTCLADVAFRYTQRLFTIVVETKNFLELDHTLVAKLLGSSALNTTSEVEVFNAADEWIIYKKKERSKFAHGLLLKVRLPLLSNDALMHLQNKNSSFSDNSNCISIIKEVLYNKDDFVRQRSDHYSQNRYCSRNEFDILICGGRQSRRTTRNASHLKGHDLNTVRHRTSMKEERSLPRAVCLKGEVYVFSGSSVEKYSPRTDAWDKVADFEKYRVRFSVCSFIDKILVIGGSVLGSPIPCRCLKFDVKECEWSGIAQMKELERTSAACAVYEGRVVVCGGMDYYCRDLETVESYDAFSDEWSSMPNMVSAKMCHGLVVVKNKLFVIGRLINSSEVYDGTVKKFVALKSPYINAFGPVQCISAGSKVIIFQNCLPISLCYDVDDNEWSEKSCELTTDISDYCCVKYHSYK